MVYLVKYFHNAIITQVVVEMNAYEQIIENFECAESWLSTQN
jgi:hypothetical protein